MRQILVMHRRKHVRQAFHAGRVLAGAVAEQRVNIGLVESDPVLDAVAEALGDGAGIVGEFLRGVAIAPAALILERLRQVPVIEAQPRRDGARRKPVDQPIVEIKTARLHDAGAIGQNARPRRREAIIGEAAAREQLDIFRPAMIVVAGDVAGIVALHPSRRMRKDVPDAFAAAVEIDRAFDLIARRRSAPNEIFRKHHIVRDCRG